MEVASYFNGMGFDRWNRIYSDSEDVNKVQRNIRLGHQKTVDDVLSWLKEANPDLLCHQETKVDDPYFPKEEFEFLYYKY